MIGEIWGGVDGTLVPDPRRENWKSTKLRDVVRS